ncbi:hypothetical protein BAU15_02765 [Enterococcus sp. JM4C]|uniref:ABC transporter ATP-binding protein n=1 Tax=Candidatus Enterococcus huntleyi TaxID=1857217 RepID=UPI00137A5D27|nr:ATP-binding cassette domain-containing protein [Enterococcus sp. JM4C]KAF1299583.1 hypothetical protein BAU15_02765 [Enterococcus sp. JM4C]
MTTAIITENVSKTINQKDIVKDISIEVEQGEILGILGRNGAGKTSLMKLLLNIVSPTTGTIQLLDKTVTKENNTVLGEIGCLIETPVFYNQLTARENLEIHCLYIDEKYCENISATLTLVGLGDNENEPVSSFSLGMKQRLGIARAVVTKPKILILDEPINGLDPIGMIDVRNILLEMNQKHQTTILISSHIITELSQIASRIIIMEEGRIIQSLGQDELDAEQRSLEEVFIQIIQDYQKPVNTLTKEENQ